MSRPDVRLQTVAPLCREVAERALERGVPVRRTLLPRAPGAVPLKVIQLLGLVVAVGTLVQPDLGF